MVKHGGFGDAGDLTQRMIERRRRLDEMQEAAPPAPAVEYLTKADFRAFKAELQKAIYGFGVHVGKRFREERGEFQVQHSHFLKEARATLRQLQSEASERRAQIVALKRENEKLADEIEILKQAIAERPGLRSIK
ncbi:hypothetical protein GOB43_17990 [Sinorhizobium meliloti]|uniref:hypothetical protein n=1 Tax=Rhizobium meliloti TaxID=382 RepID=UPI000FDCA9BC|nr:hypothetical protein [Sinorhizobium meliloti]MDW9409560.1 hypothetical protein [Sinorhizobium meliloti]MDW9440920.1 hypothetical protein [Sinorhizobium meliloti]MDW9454978.1 hypothetical protein [Sinorhizobium meliloti]MDW9467140.1 hypothetical protein [Sinorhizobium meliloti]MDW9519155.1 hypothetical protein [Sinorhizobium meliloti]